MYSGVKNHEFHFHDCAVATTLHCTYSHPFSLAGLVFSVVLKAIFQTLIGRYIYILVITGGCITLLIHEGNIRSDQKHVRT